MACWNLAKENHKFQYKIIKTGARAYEYEAPLDWLQAAGIVRKCVKVTEGIASERLRTALLGIGR
ncbi:hypothetical protein AGMMS49982_18420 [Bacteroidia bacterium]|nr:hypothetical protein AGMMS49982_18420 [Bacteroidia bacterium]